MAQVSLPEDERKLYQYKEQMGVCNRNGTSSSNSNIGSL